MNIKMEEKEKNVEIDVNELLNTVENKNSHLENKTFTMINTEIIHALKTLDCNDTQLSSMCKQLYEYRLIQEICDLHKGKCVKIIRVNQTPPVKISTFGVVSDIKFKENGIYVTCMFFHPIRYMTYKYDNYMTFQKMTEEELMILHLQEHYLM